MTVSPISPQCRNERHRVCAIPSKCDCECHDSTIVLSGVAATVVKGDRFPCRMPGCDRVFDTKQGEQVHWQRAHKSVAPPATIGEPTVSAKPEDFVEERAYLPPPSTPRPFLVARVVAFLTDRTKSEVLASAADEWAEMKMKDKDVAALVEMVERRQ